MESNLIDATLRFEKLGKDEEGRLVGGYVSLEPVTLNLKNNGGSCSNTNCDSDKNNRSICTNYNCSCASCGSTPPPVTPPTTTNPSC